MPTGTAIFLIFVIILIAVIAWFFLVRRPSTGTPPQRDTYTPAPPTARTSGPVYYEPAPQVIVDRRPVYVEPVMYQNPSLMDVIIADEIIEEIHEEHREERFEEFREERYEDRGGYDEPRYEAPPADNSFDGGWGGNDSGWGGDSGGDGSF